MKAKFVTRTDTIDRDTWLEFRKDGIGGSDAGVLMGASNYKSRFSLWAEKVGQVESTFSGNEATDWGHALELPVAQMYAKVTNQRVVAWPVMLAHPEFPFMQANVDFFIVDYATFDEFPEGEVTVHDSYDPPNGITAILEIKTTGIATRGNSRDWDNDSVPSTYIWQGAHYAAVTGISKVVYAALVGGQGLQIRERTFPQTTLDQLIREEGSFWSQVTTKSQPEPSGLADDFDTLKAMYPVSNSEEVTADHEVIMAVQVYKRLKAQISELDSAMKEARATIESYMGSADTLTDESGSVLVTYKSNKLGNGLDVKALTEAHPDIVEKFQVTKQGARVLRVKGE
jgi:putative phage-type endonuclease